MAARVNKQFLLILLAVVVIGGGIIGAVSYLKFRGDATRHVRAGDELAAAGDHRLARASYLRAIRRDPANLDYLGKAEAEMRQIQPQTTDEAIELYQEYLQLLSHGAAYHPGMAEQHLRYLAELHEAAINTGAAQIWSAISDVAATMWNSLPETDPQRIEARRYQGLALFRPERHNDLVEEDIAQGEQFLEEYLDAVPDSDSAWSALVLGRLEIADGLRLAGQKTRADEQLERTRAAAKNAMERVPEGPEVALAVLRLAIYEHGIEGSTIANEAIRRQAMRMIELVKSAPENTWLPGQMMDVLERLTWVEGLPPTIDVINEYLGEENVRLDHELLRARLLYFRGALDEADVSVRKVLDAETLTVHYLAQSQRELQRRAAGLNVDIAVVRWNSVEADERDAVEREIAARCEELETIVRDPETDTIVILARAKTAFMQNDLARAASLFDQLVREQDSVDVEVLQYAAFCHDRQGNVGRARQYVNLALQQSSSHLELRKRLLAYKADLTLRMRRLDEARETVDELLGLDPENADALRIAANLEQISTTASEPAGRLQLLLQTTQRMVDEGEYDAARDLLRGALEENPEELFLINAIIRVEVVSGNAEEAQRWLRRGLELSPDNPAFVNLRFAVEIDDPVEAAKMYAAEVYEDEATRAVEILFDLGRMAKMQEERAVTLDAAGDAEGAARARDTAARARREVEVYRERATELAPDHRKLIEFLFVEALGEEDWETAEALVARATELNTDEADGALYEGRYRVTRGQLPEAISAFRLATERIPYSALAWRSLGLTLQASGNVKEALAAYESAYESNPNDIIIVLAYARLLSQTGNDTRALAILREGQQLATGNFSLREEWLRLEAEAGEPALMLRERRRLFRHDPSDLANAAELAVFLGKTDPTRDLLLDGEGRQRFSIARWVQLSSSQQEELIDREHEAWLAEADAILDAMAPEDERDLTWHALKADLLRHRGRIDEGRALLAGYGQKSDVPEGALTFLLTMAQYQMNAGLTDGALNTLRQAREHQSPEDRRADRVIASMLFSQGRFEEAVGYIESVLEVQPTRFYELQIIECYLNMRRFDEARTRLDALTGGTEPGLTELLLDTSVTEGEADELWAAGERPRAETKYRSMYALLDRASQQSPLNPKPYAMRARAKFKEFQRKRDPVLLDDAMAALTRADEVKADLTETSLIRTAVLRAMGNQQGAINELKRLLERSPDELQARAILVQLLLAEERQNEAIELVAETVRLYPLVATWRVQLGDLQMRYLNDPESAVEHYSAAMAIESSTTTLVRLANALLSYDPPQYAGVMKLIEDHPDEVAADPSLRAVYAGALAATDRREEALEQSRLAYGRQRELIAEGAEPPGSIAVWFAGLGRIFGSDEAAEAERFARGVVGDRAGPNELRALAGLWTMREAEGIRRRAKILREALKACSREDEAMVAAIHSELGVVLVMSEQYEASVESFEKVIELRPNDALALNNAAYILADELGEPRRALAYAQRAAELRPSDSATLDTLGSIHYQLGSYDEAESYLRRSIEMQKTAANHLHLAKVFLQQGDLRRADRYVERAAELARGGESLVDPATLKEINRLADDIRTRKRAGQ